MEMSGNGGSATGDAAGTGVSTYALTDRYTEPSTTAFLSGVQALARIPIEQVAADRAAGLSTAVFASGYPGSPLGGLGDAFDHAFGLLGDSALRHIPAINEEHAATSVMGSQLANSRHDAIYDGVIGLWYGKAPGLERASDALRHAVLAGSSRNGGAVALVGDDPGAKSSTTPSNSIDLLAALNIPVLSPADPADVVLLGRHAIAMSRVSGMVTSMRVVADVADGTASVALDTDAFAPILPERPLDLLAPSGRFLPPFNLELERELVEVRHALALDYITANRLNRLTAGGSQAWLGIVATGVTVRQVHHALERLGIVGSEAIADAGIRVLSMAVPSPVETSSVLDFAAGLDTVIVIEEKKPLLEMAVRDVLSGRSNAPRVIGKSHHHGPPVVPAHGVLDPSVIAEGLRPHLVDRIGDRLRPAPESTRARIDVQVARSPFFCSGCPHNSSTVVPDGAVVGAGIGCHTMVMLGEPGRGGDIVGVTAMGNEGSQWVGMESFIEADHLIQNLGDGTYFHSGQLAITSAINAGSHITFKLLYNSAVSMTGGQTPSGQLDPQTVAAVMLAQGVARVIVTSDDPDRRTGWPAGVDVWHRRRLVEAQEVLAATPGVTVLIHDQACAAELRRDRKRGRVVTPAERVVIDHRICEGCGDCGEVSNCLSVQAVDTEFGRKTRIDQTTCNLDMSCVDGDCPSFVVVDTEPGIVARALSWLFDRRRTQARGDEPREEALEPPEPITGRALDSVSIRLTGVGGTGVVTVAQVIGTAAMLDGWSVGGVDQIGLSQKAGPVVSDLRLSRGAAPGETRLGAGEADVLIALDSLVAAGDAGLSVISPRTAVIGATSATPTASMVGHPERDLPDIAVLEDAFAALGDHERQVWADAAAITTARLGSATTANTFVVGMAVQAGGLPISIGALEEAIRLNGAAVEDNLTAFSLGRMAAAGMLDGAATTPSEESVDSLIERLANDVARHGGGRSGRRYRQVVDRVAGAEIDPSRRLTRAVAVNLHHLMAYKDEYEVADLIVDGGGDVEADEIGDGRGVRYRMLHPPVLAAMGVSRKLRLGPGWMPVFRLLRRLKFLRGTPFDPFGHTEMRRLERRAIAVYLDVVDTLLARVTDEAENYDGLVELAEVPSGVRGYESLKLERLTEMFRRFDSAA